MAKKNPNQQGSPGPNKAGQQREPKRGGQHREQDQADLANRDDDDDLRTGEQ